MGRMGVLLLLISMPDALEVYPASVFIFGGYFVLYECGAGGRLLGNSGWPASQL